MLKQVQHDKKKDEIATGTTCHLLKGKERSAQWQWSCEIALLRLAKGKERSTQ